MIEKKIVYVMTNKESGETLRVLPHTFGNGFVDFAPESEAGTEKWMAETTLYRFNNPNSDGNLSSEEYDIEKTEEEVDVEVGEKGADAVDTTAGGAENTSA